MKLPPRAHTFNFPPRGLCRTPSARTAVSQADSPSIPTTYDKLPPTFPPFRFPSQLSGKRLALLFLVTNDTNAGSLANKRQASCLIFFFFSWPRALSTPIPPMSPSALYPFVVPSYRRHCWFDVRYGISIKRVDRLRYWRTRSSSSFFLNLQIDGNASFSVKEDRSSRAQTLILSN